MIAVPDSIPIKSFLFALLGGSVLSVYLPNLCKCFTDSSLAEVFQADIS